MAGSLGSLGAFSVDVMANIAKFESDLGRAHRIAERESAKMKRALTSVAGALGVGFSVNAFAGWIKGAVDAQDKADELAQKIGITTEAASRLTVASRFSATELSGVSNSMVRLTRNAADAAAGIKAPANAFASIGVSVKDASGQMKTADVLLDEIGKKFSSWDGGINKTRAAVELFGKSGADMIPMLNDWNGHVAEAIKLSDAFGATVTTKTGAAAAKFSDNVAKLGLVSVGVGNQISTVLVPAMDKLVQAALRFFSSQDWKRALDAIGKGATFVVDNIGKIAGGIKLIGELAVIHIAGKLASSFALANLKIIQTAALSASLATEMGIVGKKTTMGMIESVKSIGLIQTAFGGLTAAAAGWQFGTYLRDEFLEVRLAGIEFVDDILAGWERMKGASAVVWEAIKFGALNALDGIAEGMASMLRGFASASDINLFGKNIFGGSTENLNALAQKFSDATKPAQGFANVVAGINGKVAENIAAIHENTSGLKDYEAAAEAAGGAVSGAADSAGAFAGALGESAPGLRDMAGAAAEAAKKSAELAAAQDTFREATLRIASDMRGPIAKAQAEYRDGIVDAWKAFQKGEATIEDFTDRQKALAAQLNKTTDELAQQANILGQYATDLNDRFSRLTMDERALAIADAVKTWTEAYKGLDEEQKKIAGPLADIIAKVEKGEGAFYDQSKAIDVAKKAAEEYEQTIGRVGDQIGDAFGRAAVDAMRGNEDAFKKLGDSLIDIAADVVQQIISEFMKMKVIYPMMDNIFGTNLVGNNSSSMFGGGGSGNGIMDLVAGMFAGSGGSTTGYNVADLYNSGALGGGGGGMDWMSTASSLYTGYGALTAGAGATSVAGTGVFANVVGGSATTAAVGGTTAATGGAMAGTMSWLAAAAPYIALIMWAVSQGDKWFKEGWDPNAPINSELYNKDFMEAGLSGDIKGIGGNTLIDWSVLATDKILQNWFGMSENSAAMWSGSSGIMRAWGYKKPVVQSSGYDLAMDEAGITGTQFANIKAKGGWFRSDKRWTETVEIADEMKAQIELFWDMVSEANTDFAEKYSLDAVKVLEATYHADFDKAGEFVGSTGSIDGRDFTGDTYEQFQARFQAENFIATLTQVDAGISDTIESYRENADEFVEAAQVVIGINGAMADGLTFLGTSANDTLSEVFAFVEGMERAGESVGDAFNRLLQANQAYFDFVGQFAPGITYVDQFQAQLSGLNAQMMANIDQANALARAAGAEGAATQDLVNIHAYAAKQFEQLLRQLKQEAQSLAFSMGLTNIGTLDQIDAEIARLQGIADQGAQSVSGFGNAMQAAAQSASDAMNLLLGDLSPLNDQRKLGIALQGLYAGTVSQEDVLAIGRRLYASGQQYVDLFNTVMQHGGQQASPGNSGSGGQPRGATGLSSADRERLEMLLDQRADAYAQQDFINAQTLAQQIAEISSASGEDVEGVLAGMGIDDAERMQEFADRLHLDNADQLLAYIENWQKQMDSNGENSASIVDAINRLGDRLLGETHRDNSARDGSGPVMPGGHSRGRDGDATNRDIVDAVDRNTHSNNRLLERLDRSTTSGQRGLRTPEAA